MKMWIQDIFWFSFIETEISLNFSTQKNREISRFSENGKGFFVATLLRDHEVGSASGSVMSG